ncbi:hypothetical protein JXR93_06165 [bacterium]|nr:hypothetical protein [bacterium]
MENKIIKKISLFFLTIELFISCSISNKVENSSSNNNRIDFVEMEPVVIFSGDKKPKDISTLFRDANSLFKEKKYEEALKIYKTIENVGDGEAFFLSKYNQAVTYEKMASLLNSCLENRDNNRGNLFNKSGSSIDNSSNLENENSSSKNSEYLDSKSTETDLTDCSESTLKKNDYIDKAIKIYQFLIQNFDSKEQLHIDSLMNLSDIYGNIKMWDKIEELIYKNIDKYRFSIHKWDYLEILIRVQIALYYLNNESESEMIFLKLNQTFKQNRERFVVLSYQQRYFMSMSMFYYGEILKHRFESIIIEGNEKTMAKILDQKADIVLSAQNYYISAIEHKDKYWATAAGFRIGEMFYIYYNQIMDTKLPEKLSFQEETIYRDELKKQISNLLKKAISVLEENLKMSERSGEKNIWISKTIESLQKIRDEYYKIKLLELNSSQNN